MNEPNANKVTGCKRADCPVNEGGACIQDMEHAEECDQAIISQPKTQEELLVVSPGNTLSLEGMATILQDRQVPTASIIGATASGKTTFLAMLFYRFLKSYKGFNNHLFMDSDTFLGLNQKLHYAVIKSGKHATKANMPRTSLTEEPVFHFKTKDKDNVEHECLWVDIPGEDMEQLLSKGVDGWGEYRGLTRTSHVLLFLDLEVVSDPAGRGPHVQNTLDALSWSIQSNTWKNCKLMVAFSKADLFSDRSKDQIKKITHDYAKVYDLFLFQFKNIFEKTLS